MQEIRLTPQTQKSDKKKILYIQLEDHVMVLKVHRTLTELEALLKKKKETIVST